MNNLSDQLSELGRREEALKAVEKAVEVYERLAEALPRVFGPRFVKSLRRLVECLEAVGRSAEAQQLAAELARLERPQ